MGRTSATKTVVEDENVVAESATDIVADTTEKMNETEAIKKITKKSVNQEPLNNSDEIEVVSLVPNVSYKDSKTLDMYQWDKVGHIEYMTFETLQNMWRNNKGYFKNMWLKPNDDRVVNKFGLTKTFANYEYLMDSSNYTRKNIDSLCDAISNTPNGLKMAICDKVKSLVADGKIADIAVVKTLEKRLRIDLIDFL